MAITSILLPPSLGVLPYKNYTSALSSCEIHSTNIFDVAASLEAFALCNSAVVFDQTESLSYLGSYMVSHNSTPSYDVIAM
jgi:hypothetical protein